MNDDIKVEPYEDNAYAITLLTTDDVGIKFKFGRVSFDENLHESGDAMLNFDYDIIEGTPRDLKAFEKTIGDLLVKMLEESLKNNTTVFANGTD